jgi:shikimate kinase
LTEAEFMIGRLKNSPKCLIVIGLPGSGKSAVGRLFAARHGLTWVDADSVLEQRLGMRVSEFFASQGEAAFRNAESMFLDAFLREDADTQEGVGRVLSTGGGVVMYSTNRDMIRRCGHPVVYIRAEVAAIERRLRNDTTRPLLQGKDKLARLQALYDLRDPLYLEVATHVITPAPNWTIARCADAVEVAVFGSKSNG